MLNAAISIANKGVRESDIPDTSKFMISHLSRWLVIAPTPFTKPLVIKAIKMPNPKPVRINPIRLRTKFKKGSSEDVADEDIKNTTKLFQQLNVKTIP